MTVCCRFVPPMFAAAALVGLPGVASAQVLLNEDFSTDPAARATVTPSGDAARFSYSSAEGTLTAAYDTLEPTTKMLWALPGGQTLTQDDAFSFSVRFRIASQDFFADPEGYAQISFGLINSVTTGTNRTGSGLDFTADTFDVVSVDYFPNLASFASPNLQGTVFGSGSGDAFNVFSSPGSAESALDGAGESRPPFDAFVTSTLAYDPTARIVTVTLADAVGNLLDINTVGTGGGGGLDGDVKTIQTQLSAATEFELDSFALLLWNDGWIFSEEPSVRANVAFDGFTVSVPEPASIAMLAFAGAAALRRRRVR